MEKFGDLAISDGTAKTFYCDVITTFDAVKIYGDSAIEELEMALSSL